jgi:DNA polymerase-3 subunit delta'
MAFSDIFGHEKQIQVLRQAIKSNRIPHAYLFYGMAGVGKRSTAMVFAKAVNCRVGGGDACDRCSSCMKADHGNHPDLKIIEPSGQSIRIQDIRDIQHQIAFRPLDGGRRVLILIDAEKMNSTAANALLKTLEEPTTANILVLTSSRPYQLPLTVLSRCQPLRYNPLGRETVERYLRERRHVPDDAARLLAASSAGSIGRAIEMNDEDYLSLRNETLEQILSLHRGDPLGLYAVIRTFGQQRRDILERLDILKVCFRDALVYKETGAIDALSNQDRAAEIQSIARAHTTADLLENLRSVERAGRAIDQNANKSLTLEAMMVRLTLKPALRRTMSSEEYCRR